MSMSLFAALRREIRPTVSLAAPVVIAEVGWVSMQIVDIAMVGRLGPEAIGAVGVGSALFLALSVFGMGLLLGLDTLVSQAFGARDHAACDGWLRHGVVLALVLTAPLGLLAWIAGGRLDVWGFDPAVLALVRPYFGIVAWSLPLLLLYAAFRRYLQAVSMVRPIMIALVTANVVNAAANWALIFGNLGAPALGVDGAGWATCISRAYMVVVLAVAVSRRGVRPWTLAAGVRIAGLRRLLGLGWPAATQAMLEYGAFAAVTMLAARLEPATLAAHQIVINLAGLTYMVPLGISAAGAVRVGHAVGRRDAAGASGAGWTAIAVGTAFMASAAATFLLVPRAILGLFTVDAGVVEVGLSLILIAALFQIFDGLQGVATGALRGLGDTRTPMLLNLAGHWGVGLPVGYLLCFVVGWGVLGLWIGVSAGLLLVGSLVTAIWWVRERALTAALAGEPAP
ncbi:MAG: MATE family efflux transporter [Acidobacteria bacterium]|nr:MATE family efflux transporter [Acidobacteriota bacterium]MYH28527.1 MATE family efflux transporter [Acidobacteriota bacterium]MYK89881.1 MATE family efflux transporter [Acidobacteriota bacterium]